MDLTSLMGGGTPGKEQKIEYTAQAVSPVVNGEVKLTVGDGALTAAALFDTAEIAFAEVNALIFADYTVTVKADGGDYVFSRMGEWGQRFYDALSDAYNKAVLRSMFIKGDPVLTANGNYRYAENGVNGGGAAPIHVYENSVAILPPDLSARRIPLCFVTGMDKGSFELTLRLDTGESYTFSKLGYDTAVFAEAVEKRIRALREKSAVKEIDPSLTAAQAAQIAKLTPEGAAAPLGRLAAIAPSFAAAMDEKLEGAAKGYKTFKELCDPEKIHVGFKKHAGGAGGATGADGMAGMLGGMLGGIAGGGVPAGEQKAPYSLWLIAPSPDGRYAAVEFAEADSATFVYETGGDFDGFARQINRALEAINFKREVIRLSADELRKPENADYYMADKRTASLQFVRSNFAGRVIHSGPEAWKHKLTELWGADTRGQAAAGPDKPRFCGQCGAALTPGVKFCGACGIQA